METLRLILKFGLKVEHEKAFYVSSFSRNLASILKLIVLGYSFSFESKIFSIFRNKNFIGDRILVDGLYKVNLNPTYEAIT